MNITDNIQDTLKKLSKQAKDKFDHAKMELKIKSYSRECKKRYSRMGMLVYECRKKGSAVNGEEIEQICKEIDKYKHKIKVIQKQIEELKSVNDDVVEYESSSNSADSESEYNSLKKKDSDLKMSRTENGIKLLKFCPECNVGNEPDASACINCGHKFK